MTMSNPILRRLLRLCALLSLATALAAPAQAQRTDLAQVLHRLRRYERAGADVLFAPGLPDLAAVRAVCAAVERPVNVLVLRGLRHARGGQRGKWITFLAMMTVPMAANLSYSTVIFSSLFGMLIWGEVIGASSAPQAVASIRPQPATSSADSAIGSSGSRWLAARPRTIRRPPGGMVAPAARSTSVSARPRRWTGPDGHWVFQPTALSTVTVGIRASAAASSEAPPTTRCGVGVPTTTWLT